MLVEGQIRHEAGRELKVAHQNVLKLHSRELLVSSRALGPILSFRRLLGSTEDKISWFDVPVSYVGPLQLGKDGHKSHDEAQELFLVVEGGARGVKPNDLVHGCLRHAIVDLLFMSCSLLPGLDFLKQVLLAYFEKHVEVLKSEAP